MQLVKSGRPGENYFTGLAHTFGIAYTTTLISLEVLVTALIVARIVHLTGTYQGTAAALVVESSLPCTLSGVVYVATFAAGSNTSVFFLSIYALFTVNFHQNYAPNLLN